MATSTIEISTSLIPHVSDAQLEAIETSRNGLLIRAQALVVNSPETEKVAWDLVNGIAELKKEIGDDFREAKEAAHKAHKAICEQEKKHLENLAEPDKIVRAKLSTWETEKRRLQAEAERQARLAAEAERQRLQAIADERARVAQQQAQREAEEQRLAEALAAEAAGQRDVATEILNKPLAVPVVAPAPVVMSVPTVVPMMAPKVEGSGAMVENWYFEITNEQEIPREYLTINESAIQKVVNALKKNARIPGIRVYAQFEARRTGRK